MTQRSLEGRVALVTGGAKRVGRAIALKLASAGMDVAITYRRSKAEAGEVARAIEAMGRSSLAIEADFADPAAVDAVDAAFTARFDRLDALVNNASIFAPASLEAITVEIFQQNMAVNALAPLLLIQRFADRLGADYREQDPTSPGRIVNFIDIHVMGEPLTGYTAYNASKAALMEITHSLAMELAPRVTVNALAPGVVAWAEQYTEQMKRDYLQRVPLARPGTPDDAADAALFLVRDANYCTGQIIRLDGGRLLT